LKFIVNDSNKFIAIKMPRNGNYMLYKISIKPGKVKLIYK